LSQTEVEPKVEKQNQTHSSDVNQIKLNQTLSKEQKIFKIN
jgi:hypothetical protein